MTIRQDYIIIALLVVIAIMAATRGCGDKVIPVTPDTTYDKIDAEMDSLTTVVATLQLRIDSLQTTITEIREKKQDTKKRYDVKKDVVRHASTARLDSIIRTIIDRTEQ